MSGFEYHARCSACGLTSPVVPFGAGRGDGIPLLAVNRATQSFEIAEIPADKESRNIPLWKLAQLHSDSTRTITAPVPEQDGLALNPPLPCPRCGAIIAAAEWGTPQPEVRDLISPEQVVAETRNLTVRSASRFRPPDGACFVECIGDSETGAHVNRWLLHRRHASAADLESFANKLIQLLTALGSRCSSLKLRSRNASFSEWPKGADS